MAAWSAPGAMTDITYNAQRYGSDESQAEKEGVGKDVRSRDGGNAEQSWLSILLPYSWPVGHGGHEKEGM